MKLILCKVKHNQIKKNALIFIFIIASLICTAQNTIEKKNKHSVYVAHDFYLTVSSNYEYLYALNLNNCIGIRTGLGVNWGEKTYTGIGELIYIRGIEKYFLEVGVGINLPYYYPENGYNHPDIMFMAGWRYQAECGFLFKIYGEYGPKALNPIIEEPG